MCSRSRRARRLLVVLLAVVAAPARPIVAQAPKSAALAQELVGLLDARKLDSVATQDATDPGRFVAALYFPGTLLIVSGSYSVPQLLTSKLEMMAYREVYIELNGASPPESRVFIQDNGANGLVSERDSADSIERGGASTVVFNRDWRSQKLASEAEYEKRYAEAETTYAQILTALIQRAR